MQSFLGNKNRIMDIFKENILQNCDRRPIKLFLNHITYLLFK